MMQRFDGEFMKASAQKRLAPMGALAVLLWLPTAVMLIFALMGASFVPVALFGVPALSLSLGTRWLWRRGLPRARAAFR